MGQYACKNSQKAFWNLIRYQISGSAFWLGYYLFFNGHGFGTAPAGIVSGFGNLFAGTNPYIIFLLLCEFGDRGRDRAVFRYGHGFCFAEIFVCGVLDLISGSAGIFTPF